MYKTTVKIDGMMCSMCEAHMNETFRKAFPNVKKISSSHKKGETTFISEEKVSEDEIRNAVTETGYEYKSTNVEPYEKKKFKLFGK